MEIDDTRGSPDVQTGRQKESVSFVETDIEYPTLDSLIEKTNL